MGVEDELRAAVRRAMDDAEERGRLDTVEGREALRRTVDLMLQLARYLLEAGEHGAAREEAQGALGLLDPLNGFAVAMPGLPGLRLDAHQIIGTVLLEQGDRAAGIEELRRAASHVYGAQPDERPISLACTLLERQLAQLWRELIPSPEAHRVRASLRAVRTMIGHLEEELRLETSALSDAPSAYEDVVGGPFFEAASRLVERPLAADSGALATLARAQGAVASAPHGTEQAIVASLELAEGLHRVGRRTDAVATVEPMIDVAASLPASTAVALCYRASTIALHGHRTDVGIRLGRIALDIALRSASQGGSTEAASEGVARFTLGRALSEGDDDEAALVECERAHRILSQVLASEDTFVRVVAAETAAYVAFLREHSGDAAGAMEALATAHDIAAQLATERPDDPAVLGTVLEVAMSTARRESERDTAYFAAAIDLLETAIARDPDDLAMAVDLFNALRFYALTLAGTKRQDAAEAQRRSLEVLERIAAADPSGLHVIFHRAELAQEQALHAHIEGRQTAFRWRAQDSMKLHAEQIALHPTLPAPIARAAKTAMQVGQVAAGMRDRKFARRLVEDGLRSARRQVELQPDVRTAHENLVTRLREAARIVAATGDRRRERELTLEVLEATRELVTLDAEDPELRYALADALTDAVAVIGEGRMKGVDHLFAELDALVASIEDVDPLHPRLRRMVFSVAEASALRAHAEDRADDAVRHAVLALSNAYGGMHIHHHHRGGKHAEGGDRHRIAVLAGMLDEVLGVATGIRSEEREEARALLVRLHRSGFGHGPTDTGSGDAPQGRLPEPDDDIPEVPAPRPVGAVGPGEVLIGGLRDGDAAASTYIKPSNGGHPELHFGVGLAASEDLIVVGAPGDPSSEHHVLVDGDAADRSASRRGAAHVYRRGIDGWLHEAYLKPPVRANGLEFGWSVAVDGERVAVGSPSATYPVEGEVLLPGERRPRLGGVWLFERTDSGWRPEDVLIPDEGRRFADFGGSIVLEGDTLLASGKDAETGHGVVIEFVLEVGEWVQRSIIRSPRAMFAGREGVVFGHSLALDGDVLVVGDPSFFGPIRTRTEDAIDDLLPGAAWVFRRDGRSEWQVEALLLGPEPRLGSTHGVAVDVRGDLIAVSAALHPNRRDEEGPDSRIGALMLYGRSATGWEALASLSPPHPHSQEFGNRVVISDDRKVLVSAALDAHGADWDEAPDVAAGRGPRYGAVHVVEETPEGWRFSAVVVSDNPGVGDELGSRIAISGADLVAAAPNDSTSGSGVGAVLHDDDARESGAVHVFHGLLA